MEDSKNNIWIAAVFIVIAILAIWFAFKSPISVALVTLENVDENQVLSPGVYIIHDASSSLNFEGGNAPSALEPLAEYGSNDAFANYANSLEGLVRMIRIDTPVLPGEQTSFEVDLSGLRGPLYLSGIQMAVGSNDGYVLLDKAEILSSRKKIVPFVLMANNFDSGTEENQPLLSGFDGGQPDPSRGEENIENGVSTSEVVTVHNQLTTPILRITVERK